MAWALESFISINVLILGFMGCVGSDLPRHEICAVIKGFTLLDHKWAYGYRHVFSDGPIYPSDTHQKEFRVWKKINR
jgi:hypothetical protein